MLVNLAMQTAEEQLRSGKASSQVITHFLRLGTERAAYEREKLKADTELARAKIEAIAAQTTSEELLQRAIQAFSSYESSHGEEDEYDEVY